MAIEFQYAGSVSRGTMRTGDLIDTFLSTLGELDADTAASLRRDPDYAGVLAYMGTDDDAWFSDAPATVRRNANYLLKALFDALDMAAPDGYSFGASEGDGSDYGFWEYEEETA